MPFLLFRFLLREDEFETHWPNKMQPIQDLLSRIRWDANWAKDDFRIGYHDRILQRVVVVAFRELIFSKDDHFSFELIDEEGALHSVPYHRAKAVYRNGRLIWHREH